MSMKTLTDFWYEQAAWSEETFGPSIERGPRGVLLHLKKEVDEALEAPNDLEEYVDLLLLVFDATRRAGFWYHELVAAAFEKLAKNKARKWPDWRNLSDVPVEHIR
jgi:hypothetical protein